MKKRFTIVAGLQLAMAVILAATGAQAAAPVMANHVVISEVQAHGANGEMDEFVELHNPTDVPMSLSGWSLQYRSSNRAIDPVVLTTLGGGTVPAHGYFLVGGSAFTHSSDQVYTGDIDPTSGTVILANTATLVSSQSDATIVDLVGYGSRADWSEGDPASSIGTGQSIERRPGGADANGIDTNDNDDDFFVRSVPRPQGTGNAPEMSEGPTFSNLSPTGYLNNRTVMIQARLTDPNGIGDEDDMVVTVDGFATNDFDFDDETGILSTQATVDEGTHTVYIKAFDEAGFMSETSWEFTVDTIKPVAFINVPDKTSVVFITANIGAEDHPAGRASGVAEMQITFDGIFDNEAWIPFSSTYARDLMHQAGTQLVHVRVRDRAGNVSDIATDTILVEFSPAVAPTAPTFTPTADQSGSFTLRWAAVPNAASYIVRYSDGQTLFGPLTTTQTSLVIAGLDPNKKYTFEIASVNQGGSVSGFTPVSLEVPAPPAPVAETSAEETQSIAQTGSVTPEAEVSPTPSPSPSPSPTGEVQGGEDDRQADWTRVIVALSILIIAAGVATGGWYLYQWSDCRGKSHFDLDG